MYLYGLGVHQDDKVAVEWYRKAANQGHAGAQHNLGAMYQTGRGVEQNMKMAMEWFRKAVDQGFTGA
jgi:TPR repeat protein